MSAAETVVLFRAAIDMNPLLNSVLIRDQLAGRDLACWCRVGSPCHGDVLLEIANG